MWASCSRGFLISLFFYCINIISKIKCTKKGCICMLEYKVIYYIYIIINIKINIYNYINIINQLWKNNISYTRCKTPCKNILHCNVVLTWKVHALQCAFHLATISNLYTNHWHIANVSMHMSYLMRCKIFFISSNVARCFSPPQRCEVFSSLQHVVMSILMKCLIPLLICSCKV